MLESLVLASPGVLALSAILFFIPLEILWPRLQGAKQWRKRLPVIAVMGVSSYALGWALAHGIQDQFVALVKSVQLVSMAKLPLPPVVIFILSFLLIDLLTYALHRISHLVPVLWRLHAVHHADEHVTAVTGHLHHPLDVVLSYLFLMAFYVVLGVPIVVVAVYVSLSALHNVFTHADIALPERLERALRFVIVTPDMHRTHHSIDLVEGNSNFGQMFPVWDLLFGTYAHRPRMSKDRLKMGLAAPSPLTDFGFLKLLMLPFHRS